MTMPHGDEARFPTSEQLKAGGLVATAKLSPGTITIHTDTSFDANHEGTCLEMLLYNNRHLFSIFYLLVGCGVSTVQHYRHVARSGDLR